MQRSGNLIALAGDIHSNWAGELKKDFLDEKSATLGVEFIGTSITTNGDGYDINDNFRRRVAKQPYVKFFNNQRGYVRHVVTPARWQADFRVLDKVTVPDGPNVDAQEPGGRKRQERHRRGVGVVLESGGFPGRRPLIQ